MVNAIPSNSMEISGMQNMLNGTPENIGDQIIQEGLQRESNIAEVKIDNGAMHMAKAQTSSNILMGQGEVLGRLGTLAMQASDPLMSDSDRQSLNAEAGELLKGLGDSVNSKFNRQDMLNGDTSHAELGTGFDYTDGDMNGVVGSVAGIDLSTQAGAQAAFTQIEGAITDVSREMAKVGANAARIGRSTDIADIQSANAAIAANRMGPDVATTMAKVAANKIQGDVKASVHKLGLQAMEQNQKFLK